MVLRSWCFVESQVKKAGAWCLVLGAWCLVPGAWCLVPGAWCLVLGAWCLVPGAWLNRRCLVESQVLGWTKDEARSTCRFNLQLLSFRIIDKLLQTLGVKLWELRQPTGVN